MQNILHNVNELHPISKRPSVQIELLGLTTEKE